MKSSFRISAVLIAQYFLGTLLAQESKISSDKMRKAELSKEDFKKIAKISSELSLIHISEPTRPY